MKWSAITANCTPSYVLETSCVICCRITFQYLFHSKLRCDQPYSLNVKNNLKFICLLCLCMYLLLHTDCHFINGNSCLVSVLCLNLNRVEIKFEQPKGCRTVHDAKCALPPPARIVIRCLEAACVMLPLVSNSSISYFWQIATSANPRACVNHAVSVHRYRFISECFCFRNAPVSIAIL